MKITFWFLKQLISKSFFFVGGWVLSYSIVNLFV
jgi:hypothetical protein